MLSLEWNSPEFFLQKKARNNLSHLLYAFIVMEKLNISCLITYIQFAAEEKRSE